MSRTDAFAASLTAISKARALLYAICESPLDPCQPRISQQAFQYAICPASRVRRTKIEGELTQIEVTVYMHGTPEYVLRYAKRIRAMLRDNATATTNAPPRRPNPSA